MFHMKLSLIGAATFELRKTIDVSQPIDFSNGFRNICIPLKINSILKILNEWTYCGMKRIKEHRGKNKDLNGLFSSNVSFTSDMGHGVTLQFSNVYLIVAAQLAGELIS